jgi:ribosomal protein L11 methylase PrmA
MTRFAFLGLIDSLESAVNRLKWAPRGTEWADYAEHSQYPVEALQQKNQLVSEFLDYTKPKMVWDLGANIGVFSRIASGKGGQTISFDVDAAAVEKNYLQCVRAEETRILPLLIDLTNPSPNTGWENNERMSLLERGPADTALALALLHHLAISNNVPLIKVASFLSQVCNSLIIEFVPKTDMQVQRLLSTRKDIFVDYTQENFEHEFSKYFTIQKSESMQNSARTLYLMQKIGK